MDKLYKPYKEDELAPYRDRKRSLCSGCEHINSPHLQKVSKCCNCVVKAVYREEAQPDFEESY
jgi:hypothetical protein